MLSLISDEDGDETSNEAANEPATPTDFIYSQAFEEDTRRKHQPLHAITPIQPSPTQNGSAASSLDGNEDCLPAKPGQQNPKSSTPRKPGIASKDSTGKFHLALSGFFKKSDSHGLEIVQQDGTALSSNKNVPVPNLGKEHRKMSFKRRSTTDSPDSTRSNSPPTPGSPTDTGRKFPPLRFQEPSKEKSPARGRTKALTFSLRDKLSRHKVLSDGPEFDSEKDLKRLRSLSVDLITQHDNSTQLNGSESLSLQRHILQMSADIGTGLKARRLSTSLTEDLQVVPTELYIEYCDQSKLLGRWGKSVGKGATASVRLMNKKGGCPGEVYAVKEFRGKSRNEKLEEYEQKVKSEYTIAKSVHHPNIVETFRLCTHNGRWNQVMEFCDHGDLFSLVSHGPLKKAEHLKDRVCLFKQLCQGINYLHNNGIAHRDIKLENLLITKDSKLKITDFGVSEVFAGIHPGLREAGGQCGQAMGEIRLCEPGMCGSPPYVAPEVIAKLDKYDPRPLDVWGAAVVMLCMTAGAPLWNEARPGNSGYDELVKGWDKWNLKHQSSDDPGPNERDYPYVYHFDNYINPPALRRILLSMLNPDPSKRLTMEAITKNGWFKAQDCCQVDSYDDPTNIIDASKKTDSFKTKPRVVHHNHLHKHEKFGHHAIRVPE